MQSLIPSSRGFVADVRTARAAVIKNRRHARRGIMIVGIMISFILAAGLLARGEIKEPSETVMSQPSFSQNDYSWRVYMLNQSEAIQEANRTTFLFNIEDLPFAFESILFGDFREDTDHEAIYYGGCGILVNASGSDGTVILKERAGKLIASVQYRGQDLIVFSGERKSVSYPVASTSYYGTDKMAEDWRNGTWHPGDGVLLDHPDNINVASATFCLMVFEPDGVVLVPEFDFVSIPVVCMLAIFVIGARRRKA
jgi:hypothetical protein